MAGLNVAGRDREFAMHAIHVLQRVVGLLFLGRESAVSMMASVIGLSGQLEVVRVVVRLVIVSVVALLAGLQESAEFVFKKNAMQRVQALGVSPRMRRIGPAVAIPSASADRQNLENGGDGI
jgi:uncharacterized membrane protein